MESLSFFLMVMTGRVPNIAHAGMSAFCNYQTRINILYPITNPGLKTTNNITSGLWFLQLLLTSLIC